MKFEFKKKQPSKVSNTPEDYLDAHVDRSGVVRKIEAGRGITHSTDHATDDANQWVQSTVETTWGMGDAGSSHTDEAIRANAWYLSQWQEAIENKDFGLAGIIKRLMLERQAEIRLSSAVKPEELKMQLVIPPKELNPSYNNAPRREPSHLDSRTS